MIDFLIFYEVKTREMESIVLLRDELIRRGYSCDIISFSEIYNSRLVKRYWGRVKVAVVPSLYHDDEIIHIVYRVAGKTRYIVNLRWEQVFNNKTENDFNNYVFPKGLAKKAIHCCWGQKPQNMLIQAGVSCENIFVTGPMQMDTLSQTFAEYYLNRTELLEKFKIDESKQCVLFISSYVLATYTNREIESYLKSVGDDKRREVENKLKNDQLSHRKTVEWLVELGIKYDVTVIYRPHPSENISNLVLENAANDNFIVIGDLNVKQWIKCCDVVLTWVSTSIVEAFFAKVPCAILRPVPIKIEDQMSVYNGSLFIESKEELDSYLYNVLIKKTNISSDFLNPDTVYSYYDHDDKKLSYIRTADVLTDLSESKYFPWNELNGKLRFARIKMLKNNIFRKLYRWMLKTYSKVVNVEEEPRSELKERAYNLLLTKKREQNNLISKDEIEHLEDVFYNALEARERNFV